MAASHLRVAGLRARARVDPHAARTLLARAAPLVPDLRERVELLLKVADESGLIGEFPAATRAFQEAAEVAKQLGDQVLELRVELWQLEAEQYINPMLDEARIVEVADRLAALGLERGDRQAMVAAEFTRAGLFLNHCRWMDNLASLERCRELADREDDPALWTTITAFIWNSLRWGPIPAPEAIARIENDETDDEARTIPRLANTSKLLAMQRRFDEARTRAQAGKNFFLERGMRMRVGGTYFDSAAVEALAGDLAAADRELAEGIATLNEIGETGIRSTLTAMHAEVLFRLGRNDAMEAAINSAREAGAPSDIATHANWRWVAAMAAADDGRGDDARALIDEALALIEPTDFLEMQASAFEALAHVEARAGRTGPSKAALERALAYHEQKGNLVGAQRVRALLDPGPS